MMKKRGNFIEEHIEKAALALAAIVCGILLYMYVLRSPNVFKYDGRNLSAGQIDILINEKAQEIKKRVNGEAGTRVAYEPNEPLFMAKMQRAVKVDANLPWPVPSAMEAKLNRKFRIPEVGPVKDAQAGHIRAVAYVPKVEITMESYNKEDSYEPNDLDLVTIQASFDTASLSENFKERFAGKEVPEDWRDEGLAKPVYAAVSLERQRLGEDGQWGQWEDVPRSKVDPRREDFRIIEDVNNLPSGSVAVRMLRYGDPKIQAALLQPEPYQIASSEEQWYPPAQHEKYLKNQRDKEAQEKRDKLEAEQARIAEERERAQAGRVDNRPRTTTPDRGVRGGGGGGSEADYLKMLGMGGGPGGPTRGTPADRQRERRIETTTATQQPKTIVKPDIETEIYEEMKKITLTDKEIGAIKEPMVFWAHDDTVEPGGTYRYRIRLGVFNPVAGTGQVREEEAANNSKVVLWSQYSEVTRPVEMPRRLYFFPVGVQEASKGVEIQVCKYVLGYWYSEQFMVKHGDVIGKEVKFDPSQKSKDKPGAKDRDAAAAAENTEDENLTLPEMIDYSTGAMLVDVVPVSGGYYDMLYSYDGTKIERMSAKLMYWPDELRGKHSEIKNLEKKPKLALRAWNSTGGVLTGRRGFTPRMPTRGPADKPGQMSPEEMMYLMMMQGGRPPGQ